MDWKLEEDVGIDDIRVGDGSGAEWREVGRSRDQIDQTLTSLTARYIMSPTFDSGIGPEHR